MRRLFRRETFIALRARRQAYQVASDILNPHMEVPEFQREVVPTERLNRPVLQYALAEFLRPIRIRNVDWLAIIAGLLLGGLFLTLLYLLS